MGRGCSNDQQASRTAGRKAACGAGGCHEPGVSLRASWTLANVQSPLETRTKSHSTIEAAPLGIESNQTNRPEPDTPLAFIGISFDIRLRMLLHNVPST